jgi:hypothetical protein
MKIELLNKEEYDFLKDKFENNKGLFIQNQGYECVIKSRLNEEDQKAFEEVENLLREKIVGFREFSNFRTNKKTGKIEIRIQYNWEWEEHVDYGFTGVGYVLLDELLNGFKND